MERDLTKGTTLVLGPEEGASFWQPGPHSGYITVKVGPHNHPSNLFSMGIQVMPAGCHVRAHGHARNDEVLFVYEGRGRCVVDGATHALEPGSTLVVGRFVEHSIFSDGPGVLLGAYPWGAYAYQWNALPAEERVAKAVEYGSQIHPQYNEEFLSGVAVGWHRVPWVLGCYGEWKDREADYTDATAMDGHTLMAGEHPSEDLRKELIAWVRKEIGPIASPDLIQFAPGLPKTRSGKIMRRILRKIAEDEYGNLGDTSTLADPTVVEDLVGNRQNKKAHA